MSTFRRVVTGHAANGKPVIATDSKVEDVAIPGLAGVFLTSLLAHFNPDDPGEHRSASTDMLFVVAGRCMLELDDGSRTELAAGDVVVQSGTMHRWKNPWHEPCRVIGALVGAHLQQGAV